MPWATILSYAAGITTAKGEGIVNAESAVEMFKTLTTDEARLEFFEKLNPYEKTRAEGVLEKVKANVDLEKFSSTAQVNLQKRFNWAALFLIILAGIYVGLSKLPSLQASDEDQLSDNSPGGKARAEANLGWDYEVGHNKPVNYSKAMKLYKRAAADGDATAYWNIARLYEFGFGVPKDCGWRTQR
jgi:TPR repeat protein